MVDRVSKFVVAFEGDEAGLSSFLSGIKNQFRAAVTEIEAITRKIALFPQLEKNVQDAGKALATATNNVQILTAAIETLKKTGDAPTKELEQGLKSANNAAADATREFNRAVDALSKLQTQLTKAGVDTGRLAAEELRLAEATRVANTALLDQQNRAALAFRSFRDIQPEVNRLNAAFNALASSGKLGFGEISIAQARLQQQVTALGSQVVGLGQAFTDIRVKILAITAAFAGVTAGVLASAKNFRDFSQQVAAVDTIADVSKARIAELAAGVRDLAKAMGVDAVLSTRALYEIISSGIPADNSLAVLAAATKAAISGLTDVDTAARVGVAVLNGYGLQVSDLTHVYDVLFQTVKDGVVTFPELARNIGFVIPAARAAQVPLEQLGAFFTVLTRQGIEAPEAATAINRAIIDLSAPAPEAAKLLQDLGIKLGTVNSVIEQIAERKLPLDIISRIVPDNRAARAVLAFSQNLTLLRDEIGLMNAAAGVMEAAYVKMAATPQQQLNRFNAAVKDLSISIGKFATGSTGGLVDTLTQIVNAFNALGPATRNTIIQFTALAVGGAALVAIFRTLAVPINLIIGALTAAGAAGHVAARGFTAASVAASGLKVALAGFAGFKLGETLREESSTVRNFGDQLGLFAAALDNLVRNGLPAFAAAVRGNAVDATRFGSEFSRNSQIIGQQYRESISGATERLRQLDAQQQAGIATLQKQAIAAANAAGQVESAIGRIASNVKSQLDGVNIFILEFQSRLTQLVGKLKENVEQIQAGAAAGIASINTQAEKQLAALDTLRNSELAIVAKTLAIQQQAAADRLAVVVKSAADALKAFDAEAAARIAVAKRSGEDIKRVEQELAVSRRAILQTQVDALNTHILGLIQQETAYLNRSKEINQQRLEFNRDVEQKLFDLRISGLSAFDQYYAKVRQIDKAISDSREALARGDAKVAEDYAKRAIELAGNIATEVKDGERTVVSAMTSQATAISKIKTAQDLVTQSFAAQQTAAEKGAAATAAALKPAQQALVDIKAQLDDVSAKIAEGISLSITANTDAVQTAIATLDEAIEKRERLMPVQADITKAQVEIGRLKDELEQGITANVKARTTEIDAALKRIEESKPELTVDVEKALDGIKAVRSAADEIDKTRHEIQTNAEDVRKEIDKLNGRDTTSTHTIKVVIDSSAVPSGIPAGAIPFVPLTLPPPGLAAGGPVGLAAGGRVTAPAPGGSAPAAPAAPWRLERVERETGIPVQRFAAGGSVFSRPTWSKVPGVGDSDSVPAALEAGSFVVRKRAAAAYGDDMMEQLVHAFAGGGQVGSTNPREAATNEQLKNLIELSVDLPKAKQEINIADWAQDLLIKLPTLPQEAVALISDTVQRAYPSLLQSVQRAAAEHQPVIVVDSTLASLAKTAADAAIPVASTTLSHVDNVQHTVTGFASGGAVFPRPAWDKVPGVGNADTVPAALDAGSFVVRKSAVAAYGEAIMGQLARAYAVGGYVAPIIVGAGGTSAAAPATSARDTATLEQLKTLIQFSVNLPKASGGTNIADWAQDLLGKLPGMPQIARTTIGGTLQRVYPTLLQAVQNAAVRQQPVVVDAGLARLAETAVAAAVAPVPKTADELKTPENVITYIDALLQQMGQFVTPTALGPVGSSLAIQARNELSGKLAQVKSAPTKEAIDDLLEQAAYVARLISFGTARGSFGQSPVITFERYLASRGLLRSNERPTQNTPPGFVPYAFGTVPLTAFQPLRLLAEGGAASDTVPAMLTPGEFVVSRTAVQNITRIFGGGFLDAVNQMRIAPVVLANVMNPPPRPRGYATGGYVNDLRPPSAPNVTTRGGDTTINVNAAAGSLLSPDNVRRFILPVLRDVERKR